MVSNTVQLGLDLATSITIIIAILTLVINGRKERSLKIGDEVRATIVANLTTSIHKMASSFLELVQLNQKIERKITLRLNHGGVERLIEEISSNNMGIDDIMKQLQDITNAMKAFYEEGEALKYTIFPSLYVINANDKGKTVSAIRDKLNPLAELFNVCNSNLRYMKELKLLLDEIESMGKDSDPNDIVNQCKKKVSSIILDYDYYRFTCDVLEHSEEDMFRAFLIKNPDQRTAEEKQFVNKVFVRFLMAAIESPAKLWVNFLVRLRNQVQENRIACKEFLIVLSTISTKMQQRGNNVYIDEINKTLSSADYFDVDGLIR